MAHEYRNLIIAGARVNNPGMTEVEIQDFLLNAVEVGRQAMRAREVGISLRDAYKAVYVFTGGHPDVDMETITPQTETLFMNYAREVMRERLERVHGDGR